MNIHARNIIKDDFQLPAVDQRWVSVEVKRFKDILKGPMGYHAHLSWIKTHDQDYPLN